MMNFIMLFSKYCAIFPAAHFGKGNNTEPRKDLWSLPFVCFLFQLWKRNLHSTNHNSFTFSSHFRFMSNIHFETVTVIHIFTVHFPTFFWQTKQDRVVPKSTNRKDNHVRLRTSLWTIGEDGLKPNPKPKPNPKKRNLEKGKEEKEKTFWIRTPKLTVPRAITQPTVLNGNSLQIT